MFNFIKLSDEAQWAAKWCARKGLTGDIGDALPNLLSVRACDEIDANQAAFKLCVHLHRAFEYHN